MFSVLFFFTVGVASLTLNAAQPLVPKPLATLNPSNLSANASLPNGQLASSSNLSHLIIQCDPDGYGSDLKYDSCHDAYEQIPHFISDLT